MKKLILIIVLVIIGYMLYNYFFAPAREEAIEIGEDVVAETYAARQVEAKEMLRKAYQAQESFHSQFGHYTYKFDSLGIEPEGTFYELKIKIAKITNFEIRAEGNIDNDGYLDIWVITENGNPYNLVNDIEKN